MMELLSDLERKNAMPFIKWAGGKKKVAPLIENFIEQQIDIEQIDTYIEPFVGGGAFFFYLANKYDIKNKIITDINSELINTYKMIKNYPNEMTKLLSSIQNEYNNLGNLEEKKAHFYNVREQFNAAIKDSNEEGIAQAARFIYLNKIGFNGLYRVNKSGLFNVPFGKRENASLFNKENLLMVSEILQDTEIYNQDYRESKRFSGPKTLFYFDPPYRPLSTTSSFTSYAKSNFNDASQIKLANLCSDIVQDGSTFALSNSDPKQKDTDDNFFDEIYSEFQINRISTSRMIGASASSRGSVSEILVIGK